MSSTPPPTEQSTFLQDTRQGGIAVQSGFFAAAFVAAIGAGIYWENLIVGILGWVEAYFGFSFTYALLARRFGWRRLRWMAFFKGVIAFLWLFR